MPPAAEVTHRLSRRMPVMPGEQATAPRERTWTRSTRVPFAKTLSP